MGGRAPPSGNHHLQSSRSASASFANGASLEKKTHQSPRHALVVIAHQRFLKTCLNSLNHLSLETINQLMSIPLLLIYNAFFLPYFIANCNCTLGIPRYSTSEALTAEASPWVPISSTTNTFGLTGLTVTDRRGAGKPGP